MTIQTTTQTVTFSRPFFLGSLDAELPAGDYSVETDTRKTDDGTDHAYRRIRARIHLNPHPTRPGGRQTFPINLVDLDVALCKSREGPRPG